MTVVQAHTWVSHSGYVSPELGVDALVANTPHNAQVAAAQAAGYPAVASAQCAQEGLSRAHLSVLGESVKESGAVAPGALTPYLTLTHNGSGSLCASSLSIA